MKLVLLCACLLMFDAVEGIRKKENEKNKEKGKKFRPCSYVQDMEQDMREHRPSHNCHLPHAPPEYCESAGNCQDDEALGRRQKLKDDLVKLGANEADVEERLAKTREAKEALRKSSGVEDIEPPDDGVWSGDILLSPEQAQEIIDYYSVEEEDIVPPTPEEVEQGKGKKKEHNVKKRSSSYDFNEKPLSQWPLPIPYFLYSDFTADEKDLISNALETISSSSGCINFTELEAPYETGGYILFERYEPICWENGCTCGESYVGKQKNLQPTVCFINTDPNHPTCSTGSGLMHNILHQIMHALGFIHEHQRMDRDSYVTIDPMCSMSKDENSATYGTKYDFLSIMHFALDECIQLSGTEGSEYADQIGKGETLSELDIVGLKAAYCGAPAKTCWDYYDGTFMTTCPELESTYHICTDPDYAYLIPYCNHTCGLC